MFLELLEEQGIVYFNSVTGAGFTKRLAVASTASRVTLMLTCCQVSICFILSLLSAHYTTGRALRHTAEKKTRPSVLVFFAVSIIPRVHFLAVIFSFLFTAPCVSFIADGKHFISNVLSRSRLIVRDIKGQTADAFSEPKFAASRRPNSAG